MSRRGRLFYWGTWLAAALAGGLLVVKVALNLMSLPVPDLAWRTPVVLLFAMMGFIVAALHIEEDLGGKEAPGGMVKDCPKPE